jgi:hypothetical protein
MVSVAISKTKKTSAQAEAVPENQPRWIKPLIDGYKNGYTDVEVCRDLEITKKTFASMYKENEGFRKLVDYGRTLSEAWWCEQGRKNMWNKDFAVSLWNFNMKNRFGWADKTEVKTGDNDIEGSVNLDDMRTKLHAALPKILKHFQPELADAKLLEQLKQDHTNETN